MAYGYRKRRSTSRRRTRSAPKARRYNRGSAYRGRRSAAPKRTRRVSGARRKAAPRTIRIVVVQEPQRLGAVTPKPQAHQPQRARF